MYAIHFCVNAPLANSETFLSHYIDMEKYVQLDNGNWVERGYFHVDNRLFVQATAHEAYYGTILGRVAIPIQDAQLLDCQCLDETTLNYYADRVLNYQDMLAKIDNDKVKPVQSTPEEQHRVVLEGFAKRFYPSKEMVVVETLDLKLLDSYNNLKQRGFDLDDDYRPFHYDYIPHMPVYGVLLDNTLYLARRRKLIVSLIRAAAVYKYMQNGMEDEEQSKVDDEIDRFGSKFTKNKKVNYAKLSLDDCINPKRVVQYNNFRDFIIHGVPVYNVPGCNYTCALSAIAAYKAFRSNMAVDLFWEYMRGDKISQDDYVERLYQVLAHFFPNMDFPPVEEGGYTYNQIMGLAGMLGIEFYRGEDWKGKMHSYHNFPKKDGLVVYESHVYIYTSHTVGTPVLEGATFEKLMKNDLRLITKCSSQEEPVIADRKVGWNLKDLCEEYAAFMSGPTIDDIMKDVMRYSFGKIITDDEAVDKITEVIENPATLVAEAFSRKLKDSIDTLKNKKVETDKPAFNDAAKLRLLQDIKQYDSYQFRTFSTKYHSFRDVGLQHQYGPYVTQHILHKYWPEAFTPALLKLYEDLPKKPYSHPFVRDANDYMYACAVNEYHDYECAFVRKHNLRPRLLDPGSKPIKTDLAFNKAISKGLLKAYCVRPIGTAPEGHNFISINQDYVAKWENDYEFVDAWLDADYRVDEPTIMLSNDAHYYEGMWEYTAADLNDGKLLTAFVVMTIFPEKDGVYYTFDNEAKATVKNGSVTYQARQNYEYTHPNFRWPSVDGGTATRQYGKYRVHINEVRKIMVGPQISIVLLRVVAAGNSPCKEPDMLQNLSYTDIKIERTQKLEMEFDITSSYNIESDIYSTCVLKYVLDAAMDASNSAIAITRQSTMEKTVEKNLRYEGYFVSDDVRIMIRDAILYAVRQKAKHQAEYAANRINDDERFNHASKLQEKSLKEQLSQHVLDGALKMFKSILPIGNIGVISKRVTGPAGHPGEEYIDEPVGAGKIGFMLKLKRKVNKALFGRYITKQAKQSRSAHTLAALEIAVVANTGQEALSTVVLSLTTFGLALLAKVTLLKYGSIAILGIGCIRYLYKMLCSNAFLDSLPPEIVTKVVEYYLEHDCNVVLTLNQFTKAGVPLRPDDDLLHEAQHLNRLHQTLERNRIAFNVLNAYIDIQHVRKRFYVPAVVLTVGGMLTYLNPYAGIPCFVVGGLRLLCTCIQYYRSLKNLKRYPEDIVNEVKRNIVCKGLIQTEYDINESLLQAGNHEGSLDSVVTHVSDDRSTYLKRDMGYQYRHIEFSDPKLQRKWDRGIPITHDDIPCTCKDNDYKVTGHRVLTNGNVVGTYYLNNCTRNGFHAILKRQLQRVPLPDDKFFDKLENWYTSYFEPMMEERYSMIKDSLAATLESFLSSRKPNKAKKYSINIDANIVEDRIVDTFTMFVKNDEKKYGSVEAVANVEKARIICGPHRSGTGLHLAVNYALIEAYKKMFPQVTMAMNAQLLGRRMTRLQNLVGNEPAINKVHRNRAEAIRAHDLASRRSLFETLQNPQMRSYNMDGQNHDAHQNVRILWFHNRLITQFFERICDQLDIPEGVRPELLRHLTNTSYKAYYMKDSHDYHFKVYFEGTVASGMGIHTTLGNTHWITLRNMYFCDLAGLESNHCYYDNDFCRFEYTKYNDIFLSGNGDDSEFKDVSFVKHNLLDIIKTHISVNNNAVKKGTGESMAMIYDYPFEYTDYLSLHSIRNSVGDIVYFRQIHKAVLGGQVAKAAMDTNTHRFSQCLALELWCDNVPIACDMARELRRKLTHDHYAADKKQKKMIDSYIKSYDVKMQKTDSHLIESDKVIEMWEYVYGLPRGLNYSVEFNRDTMQCQVFDFLFAKYGAHYPENIEPEISKLMSNNIVNLNAQPANARSFRAKDKKKNKVKEVVVNVKVPKSAPKPSRPRLTNKQAKQYFNPRVRAANKYVSKKERAGILSHKAAQEYYMATQFDASLYRTRGVALNSFNETARSAYRASWTYTPASTTTCAWIQIRPKACINVTNNNITYYEAASLTALPSATAQAAAMFAAVNGNIYQETRITGWTVKATVLGQILNASGEFTCNVDMSGSGNTVSIAESNLLNAPFTCTNVIRPGAQTVMSMTATTPTDTAFGNNAPSLAGCQYILLTGITPGSNISLRLDAYVVCDNVPLQTSYPEVDAGLSQVKPDAVMRVSELAWECPSLLIGNADEHAAAMQKYFGHLVSNHAKSSFNVQGVFARSNVHEPLVFGMNPDPHTEEEVAVIRDEGFATPMREDNYIDAAIGYLETGEKVYQKVTNAASKAFDSADRLCSTKIGGLLPGCGVIKSLSNNGAQSAMIRESNPEDYETIEIYKNKK